jgi:hypothetical protein
MAKKCKAALDARKDGLTWKDEYLVYCLYVQAGMTQEFCSSIFDIADGSVSEIFMLERILWMLLFATCSLV